MVAITKQANEEIESDDCKPDPKTGKVPLVGNTDGRMMTEDRGQKTKVRDLWLIGLNG